MLPISTLPRANTRMRGGVDTRALRYRPAILAERAGLRHLLNTIIGPQGYERV